VVSVTPEEFTSMIFRKRSGTPRRNGRRPRSRVVDEKIEAVEMPEGLIDHFPPVVRHAHVGGQHLQNASPVAGLAGELVQQLGGPGHGKDAHPRRAARTARARPMPCEAP